MWDAFISYSRQDSDVAKALSDRLKKLRLKVFFDVHSMRVGGDWPPQIGAAINEASVLVVCWSEAAANSNWVRAEINQGLSLKHPIVLLPWRLDHTALPGLLAQRHAATEVDEVIKTVVNICKRRKRRRFIRNSLLLLALFVIASISFLWWLGSNPQWLAGLPAPPADMSFTKRVRIARDEPWQDPMNNCIFVDESKFVVVIKTNQDTVFGQKHYLSYILEGEDGLRQEYGVDEDAIHNREIRFMPGSTFAYVGNFLDSAMIPGRRLRVSWSECGADHIRTLVYVQVLPHNATY